MDETRPLSPNTLLSFPTVRWTVHLPHLHLENPQPLSTLHGHLLPVSLELWTPLLGEATLDRLVHFIRHALPGTQLDVQIETADGSIRPLRHQIQERTLEHVTLHSWLNVSAEPELQAAHTKLDLASRVAELGFWTIDGRSGRCMVDDTARSLLGLPEEQMELSLQGVLNLGEQAHQEVLWGLFLQQLTCGQSPFTGTMESDIQVHHPQEGPSHLHIQARVLGEHPPQSQQVVGVVCRSWDPQSSQRLFPLQQDPLTGLPNRRYFLERIEQHLHLHQHSGLSCAVLMLDLDRFKDINARYGTHLGDQVLCQVASCLQGALRSTDILARMGGDSFGVLLTGVKDTETVTLIAERLLNLLPGVPVPPAETLQVKGTIGLALYPQDSEQADTLLACAEDALAAAKQQARTGYVFFERHLQQERQEKQCLTQQLQQALQDRKLEVYYQPILDAQTGALHKAEALVRWKHPQRGFISPAVFIPLAEDSGLIHDLGRQVMDTVMDQLTCWDQAGLPQVTVSINLSAQQFVQEGTILHLLTGMQKRCLTSNRIIVEITESVFLQDHTRVKQQFQLLEEAGIQIALDDFGTGYSSLSYLTRFNPQYIKIDRSFVQQIGDDVSSSIMEAIIHMGHHLQKWVVAEGVETETQKGWLQDRGCQYLQGYLFSRPVPAEQFAVLLKSQP